MNLIVIFQHAHKLRQTPGAHGHWSQIYGVYHDRYVRTGDRWWFAHRQYHSLARHDLPATILPFPDHLDPRSL